MTGLRRLDTMGSQRYFQYSLSRTTEHVHDPESPGRRQRPPPDRKGRVRMECTSFAQAKPYNAPKHNGCVSYRLQGLEASATKSFWVGLSHFLPGGGAEMDASPFEKAYVVTEGEVTVITAAGQRQVLRKYDSCIIPANEAREVINESHLPASMVVVLSKVSEPA